MRLTSPFAAVFDAIGETLSANSGAPQSELEAEIERLLSENAALRERAGLVAELEETLDFTTSNPDPERRLVGAEVIQRETSNFRDIVAVDRGADNGIEEGMVVLSPSGSLVGRVIEVMPSTSWVQLISDPRTKINVRVQRAEATGVMEIEGSGVMSLELATKNVDIQVGDSVVTESLTGQYPSGILIGLVSEVNSSEELFLRVRIEPTASLSNLDGVRIVTSFVPSPIVEPAE